MENSFFSIISYSSKNIDYKKIYYNFAEETYWHNIGKERRKNPKRRISNDFFVNVPFEIIFVGNNPPQEPMPNNFRYIKSDEKLTKCIEIGVQNSKSDYLIFVNENMTYSNMYLSWLYMFSTRVLLNFQNMIILPRYSFGGTIRPDLMHFNVDDNLSPLVSRSLLCGKKEWSRLDCINDQFNSNLFIIDMQMKFYKNGYTPFIVPMAINDETVISENELKDKDLLNCLWRDNGK